MTRVAHGRGQVALETCLLLTMVIFALIALTDYVRGVAAGRLKTSSDFLSQTPFNPDGGMVGFDQCSESFSRRLLVTSGKIETRSRFRAASQQETALSGLAFAGAGVCSDLPPWPPP